MGERDLSPRSNYRAKDTRRNSRTADHGHSTSTSDADNRMDIFYFLPEKSCCRAIKSQKRSKKNLIIKAMECYWIIKPCLFSLFKLEKKIVPKRKINIALV